MALRNYTDPKHDPFIQGHDDYKAKLNRIYTLPQDHILYLDGRAMAERDEIAVARSKSLR